MTEETKKASYEELKKRFKDNLERAKVVGGYCILLSLVKEKSFKEHPIKAINEYLELSDKELHKKIKEEEKRRVKKK